jgi:RNA polymerase sigma-70 factor (ECF subfamily)
VAAVPSIGRASGVEPGPIVAPEADATRALYERYSRQIYNYCVHQLSSREEAEDAVQTTFMNAFRGLQRGVVPEAEQAWLFKIAENVCLSRRRSSWRRGRVESPNDFEVLQEIVPSQHNRRADELIGLEDALEAMPENQRRAILLREWQGLSYREIGVELGVSQAAVETLIFRARRSLAAGLEQPPEKKSKKARLKQAAQGANLGSAIAGLKTLLTGGAAVKAVVVAVAAGTATVAATESVSHHRYQGVAPKSQRAVRVTPQAAAAFSAETNLVRRTSGLSPVQLHAKLHPVSLDSQGPQNAHGKFIGAPTEDPSHTTTPPLVPPAPAPTAPAPVAPQPTQPAAPTAGDSHPTPPPEQPRNGGDNQGNANTGSSATAGDKGTTANGNGDNKTKGEAPRTPASTTPPPASPAPAGNDKSNGDTKGNGDSGNNGNRASDKKSDPAPTQPTQTQDQTQTTPVVSNTPTHGDGNPSSGDKGNGGGDKGNGGGDKGNGGGDKGKGH